MSINTHTWRLCLVACDCCDCLALYPPQGAGGGSGLSRNVGAGASTRARAFPGEDQGGHPEKEEAIAAEAIGRECVGRRRLVRVESICTGQKCITPACCATSSGLFSLLIVCITCVKLGASQHCTGDI